MTAAVVNFLIDQINTINYDERITTYVSMY